jgi:hypothetical protein
MKNSVLERPLTVAALRRIVKARLASEEDLGELPHCAKHLAELRLNRARRTLTPDKEYRKGRAEWLEWKTP